MAKRVADKELTHDNWDQEDDEEEVSIYQTTNRVIFTAVFLLSTPRSKFLDASLADTNFLSSMVGARFLFCCNRAQFLTNLKPFRYVTGWSFQDCLR